MKTKTSRDGFEYQIVPCIMINGAERGWFDRADFREWLEKGEPAHWPLDAGGDLFTTWDHGEGCDNPEPMEPGPGIMPQWLWDEIKKVVQDAGLEDSYCVVRVMGA